MMTEDDNYSGNNNNDQSNLAKGGIAVANPPNSSFVFAGWQHKTVGLAATCNCVFCLGIRSQNLLRPSGAKDLI